MWIQHLDERERQIKLEPFPRNKKVIISPETRFIRVVNETTGKVRRYITGTREEITRTIEQIIQTYLENDDLRAATTMDDKWTKAEANFPPTQHAQLCLHSFEIKPVPRKKK